MSAAKTPKVDKRISREQLSNEINDICSLVGETIHYMKGTDGVDGSELIVVKTLLEAAYKRSCDLVEKM